MPERRAGVGLCIALLLAGCGVGGSAGGEQPDRSGPEAAPGRVSVSRYCEAFARAYSANNAIDDTDLSVTVERKADIARWLSNAFSPSDSRFTSGYECRVSARQHDGEVHTASVGLFLTGTLRFAEYTQWPGLQIVPIAHVVDATHGRSGYGVFKYLRAP